MDNNQCNAAIVRDMAAAIGAPNSAEAEAKPYAIVPAGYTLHDLEPTLMQPVRFRGTTALRDMASFTAFVAELAAENATRLYGQLNPPKFKAVFNDHDRDSGPGWRDHIATYDCPLSVEWLAWMGSNGKVMPQADFATFIEDNAPDIASPPAADMIEISRTLEAKKKVNFASGIRLDNGQIEFVYEEQIDSTAAKGRLQIPQTFTIGIAVLEGGPRYAVTARLRYRIGEKGALALWYDLERPHKVVEDAAKEVWLAIERDTGLRVFNGC